MSGDYNRVITFNQVRIVDEVYGSLCVCTVMQLLVADIYVVFLTKAVKKGQKPPYMLLTGSIFGCRQIYHL